jgi:zinc transport system ATP-binding protein
VTAATSATAGAGQAPVIALRGAAFGYAGRPVAEDLTLTITPGEVVALLGPNGSGKSTLVRGLLGLNDHLAGTVELFGTPAARFTDRSRLGYVPQRHTLSGSVRSTVREVVATGRLSTRPWWRPSSSADRDAVLEALRTVGLGDRADADVATLSGGQQRRVLIARALAARPDMLVMDEPTAGVDAASQEVLAAVLRRLAGLGVTMLVVTHELAALRGIVDRIVVMSAGQLRYDGTPRGYAQQQRAEHLRGHVHHDHQHHDDEHDDLPAGFLGAGPFDTRNPAERRGRR